MFELNAKLANEYLCRSMDTFAETVDGNRQVIVAGCSEYNIGNNDNAGIHHVYRWEPYLFSSVSEISISAGGTSHLIYDFPSAADGMDYMTLASFAGAGPYHYGVDIPITPDSLTQLTASGALPDYFLNGLGGSLDALGNAAGFFHVAPNSMPTLVGQTAFLAAVAYPNGGLPQFSSASVTLTFTL